MTVFIRIAMRYLAAALVARGLLLPSDGDMLATDPQIIAAIEIALGAALAAAAEGWYWIARRLGWRT